MVWCRGLVQKGEDQSILVSGEVRSAVVGGAAAASLRYL